MIAKENSNKYSFLYLTGIEISARYEGRKIEILGYDFDYKNEHLNKQLDFLQNKRKERVNKILIKLNNLGIKLSEEDIKEQLGKALSPGRPHFARALIKKGYVNTVTEAFDKYLSEGRPAYVKRETISPKDAITLIHQAGGVAVLPHPLYVEVLDISKLQKYLDLLLKWGLDGIEVYYNYRESLSEISKEKINEAILFIEEFCEKNNLLKTAGSDFHGDIGNLGDVEVPEKLGSEIIEFFKSRV